MTKHLVVFITSLTILLLIAGCPQVTPEPIEPPKVEPPKVEPATVEPNKPKPYPIVSFHDKCADILENYVDERGMVNYKTLKRKKPQLKQLLDEFAKLDPNEYSCWPKEDKTAVQFLQG